MENLPIDVLEQILADTRLSVFDIFNSLQTCKYLKTTIEGCKFIWKQVFIQRWPELPPLMRLSNNEEIDWFNEVKNILKVQLRTRHLGATMSSLTNLKRKHFFSSDLIDWNELMAEGKYNQLYVHKYLKFIIYEKCDINTPTALPTAPGNLTVRYYCREVFYQLHQQKCLNELQDFLRVPEKFRTLEKCATIVARSFQPFKDITYENVREMLDTIAHEVKEKLRNINPNHPLFAISEDIQLSWKDHTINESTFEKYHVLQVLEAFKDIFNIFIQKQYDRNYCSDKISLCLDYFRLFDGRRGYPRILIILESICRRLGVDFIPFVCVSMDPTFQMFVKNQLVEFRIYFDYERILDIRSVDNSPIHVINCAATADVIIRLLTFISTRLFLIPLSHKSKLTCRLKMLLEPDKFEHIEEYTSLFENFRVCKRLWSLNKSDYEGLNLEKMLINHCRHNELGEMNLPVQRKSMDSPVFPIGSIVMIKSTNCKGVIVASTPIFAKEVFWEFSEVNPKFSAEDFFLVINKFEGKNVISADNLILDANPTPLPGCNIYLGKYFTHFFGKQYIPNKEWVAFIDSEIEKKGEINPKIEKLHPE